MADLPVGQAGGDQGADLPLAVSQAAQSGGEGGLAVAQFTAAAFQPGTQCVDAPGKIILRAGLQQWGQVAVVLGQGQGQAVFLGFKQGLAQQAGGLGPLVQHSVGGGGLDADVQRNRFIMEQTAGMQQLFAAANDLGPLLLRQVDLVLDQLHHGQGGG